MRNADSIRCPFCNVDQSRFLVANETAFAVRDSYPVSEAHTLVISRRHIASLYELSRDDQSKMWDLAATVRGFLKQSGVDAFNIGVNDGTLAGQTVAHAHIHVIPRRLGDCSDPRGGIRYVLPEKARYWQ